MERMMSVRASISHTSSFTNRIAKRTVSRKNPLYKKPSLPLLSSEKTNYKHSNKHKLYSDLELRTIEKYILDIELAMGHFAIYQDSKELQDSVSNLKSCTMQLRKYLTNDTACMSDKSLKENRMYKEEIGQKIENYYS
ncbi:hypothetical protein [Enterococcus sp. 4E1_DIV0656]|uniref:hypothetical protein n=1 Tax=Enterococcus sp. 4E1_DIV0656 TaxID=1834180 RepID=UPI0011230762|nr:hypothetical protein [Enterococcus sp. 4E1_DIV0656]